MRKELSTPFRSLKIKNIQTKQKETRNRKLINIEVKSNVMENKSNGKHKKIQSSSLKRLKIMALQA